MSKNNTLQNYLPQKLSNISLDRIDSMYTTKSLSHLEKIASTYRCFLNINQVIIVQEFKNNFELKRLNHMDNLWGLVKTKPIPDPTEIFKKNKKQCLPIMYMAPRIVRLFILNKFPGRKTECILCKDYIYSYVKHINMCCALPNEL